MDASRLADDGYPAAAALAEWLHEALAAADALTALGAALGDASQRTGNRNQAAFLDVASPLPSVVALTTPPQDPRRVIFTADRVGAWWGLDVPEEVPE